MRHQHVHGVFESKNQFPPLSAENRNGFRIDFRRVLRLRDFLRKDSIAFAKTVDRDFRPFGGPIACEFGVGTG